MRKLYDVSLAVTTIESATGLIVDETVIEGQTWAESAAKAKSNVCFRNRVPMPGRPIEFPFGGIVKQTICTRCEAQKGRVMA